MLHWEWFHHAPTFQVFMYLLLTANHEPRRYQGHEIPIGSTVTGLGKLASSCRLTKQSIRTALNHLKSTHEITLKTTNKFSIISITNWQLYQDDQHTNQHSTNTQLTLNQHSTNTTIRIKELKNIRIKEEDDYGGLAVSPPRPTPPNINYSNPDWDGGNEDAINPKARVLLDKEKFALPDEFFDYAKPLGWTASEIQAECHKFKFYFTQGKGQGTRRTVKGWRQSWHNWLTNANKRRV